MKQLIFRMRGRSSVTMSAVTEMINSTSLLFEDTLGSLREKVKASFQEHNIDMQSESVQEVLNSFNSFSKPFEELKTPCQQTKYMKETIKMVSPVCLTLGTRYDQHVDRLTGAMVQKLVPETVQYVPLLKTLAFILNADIRTSIGNERRAEGDHLEGFVYGEQFKHHPLFMEHPNALRIQLYYDDVELANPLGSKNTIHKIGLFYFCLDNLPRKLNSKLSMVHLLAVCHTVDLKKKHGFHPILKQFINEMKELESDTGVKLQLCTGPTTVHGTLSSVVGDTRYA